MHEVLAKAKFEADVGGLSDAAAKRIGLTVLSREFPVLDLVIEHQRPLRIRLQCDDWDDKPASVELLTVEGTPWTLPMQPNVPSIFNASAHPNNGKFFICMRGVREYHTHTSHTNDSWEHYKGQVGMGIWGLAQQIASAWRKV